LQVFTPLLLLLLVLVLPLLIRVLPLQILMLLLHFRPPLLGTMGTCRMRQSVVQRADAQYSATEDSVRRATKSKIPEMIVPSWSIRSRKSGGNIGGAIVAPSPLQL
jgi:hypothetical protein